MQKTKLKTQSSQKAKKTATAPLAVARTMKTTAPRINGVQGQVITVRRKELVGTVTNGSNYTFWINNESTSTPGYDISPTNSVVFPWASGIATSFEKFRFDRVHFELISSQPATTAGRVYMGVDPDWDDPVPNSKTQLAGLMCSVSGGVWESLGLEVPCAAFNRGQEWRYCNVANRESPEPRTSFMGFLTIGIDSPTTCLWDLWVDYEVHLAVPTSEQPTAGSSVGVIQYPTAGNVFGVKFNSNVTGPLSIRDMASALGHYFVPGNPCDLIEIPPSRKGLITSDMVLGQTAKSPTTALFTDHLRTIWKCVDKAGNVLFDIDGEAGGFSSIADQVVGVYNAFSSMGGTGTESRQKIAFRIEDVLAQYPLTRYLIPVVTALAYTTFGSVKDFSVKYEL